MIVLGPDAIERELEQAHKLGFLGPSPAAVQLRHAMGFVAVVQAAAPGGIARGVDLGTGGGVPGLVCAMAWPHARWWFVERSAGRARFLRSSIRRLGLEDRVTAVEADATQVSPLTIGGAVDLVTARSFGPASRVAEIASGLLRSGGVLAVSDPPGGTERWGELAERCGFDVACSAIEPVAVTVLRRH